MTTAKLFWSGRSQAVRLPKEFRFEGTEVEIRREGGVVVLESAKSPADEWSWLDRLPGRLSDSMIAATEEEPGQQERPELDKLFQ